MLTVVSQHKAYKNHDQRGKDECVYRYLYLIVGVKRMAEEGGKLAPRIHILAVSTSAHKHPHPHTHVYVNMSVLFRYTTNIFTSKLEIESDRPLNK